jgi:integrase
VAHQSALVDSVNDTCPVGGGGPFVSKFKMTAVQALLAISTPNSTERIPDLSGTKNHRGWGWIRKRASGRYQASYIGPDNLRHYAPTTFDHRIDAEEWLTAERREIQNAASAARGAAVSGGQAGLQWISPAQRQAAVCESMQSEVTLCKYATEWIAQRPLKPRTRIHYTRIWENHIAPELGSISIGNLRPARVRTWYATALADKPPLRRHAYQLLHAICATAVGDELLSRNPCMIKGATAVTSMRDPVVPSVDELAMIADTIQTKLKAYVLISAWCGLRFGEATELRRRDIEHTKGDDFAPEMIVVRRGVVHRRGDDGQWCRIDTPKSGRHHRITIPPHIRAAIDEHLKRFVAPDPEALLFVPARGGCHVDGRVVRDAFREACHAANAPGMRLHDLRHFAGTMTAQVANLVETMDRLGHSTPNASLRYQSQVDGRAAEIAEALSALAVSGRDLPSAARSIA